MRHALKLRTASIGAAIVLTAAVVALPGTPTTAAPHRAPIVASGGGGSGSTVVGGRVITRIEEWLRGGWTKPRNPAPAPSCVLRSVPDGYYSNIIRLVGTVHLEGLSEIPEDFQVLLDENVTATSIVVYERYCDYAPTGEFVLSIKPVQEDDPWVVIIGTVMITTPTPKVPILQPDLGHSEGAPVPTGQRVFATIDPENWKPVIQTLVFRGESRSIMLTPLRYTYAVAGTDGATCTDVPGPGLPFDPGLGVEAQAESPGRCSFIVPPEPEGGWPALSTLTVTWKAEQYVDDQWLFLAELDRTSLVRLFGRRLDTAIRR